MAVKRLTRPDPFVRDCVFHRDPSSQAAYCVDSKFNKTFTIPEGVKVVYSGSLIPVEQLAEGTRCTLKLQSSLVESIEVTYLCERKSPLQLYRESNIVFASRKFHTSMLVFENRDNPSAHYAAQTIEAKCPGIRKVSNGFWTAVGLAYLEHLALWGADDSEMQYFRGLITQAGSTSGLGNYLEEVFACKLRALRQQQGRRPEMLPGDLIDSWHNNLIFQEELVKALKDITVDYVRRNPTHEKLAFFEGGAAGLQTKLEYGQEVSEELIAFVACALPIKLVVYSLDPTQLRKSYETDASHFSSTRVAYIWLLEQFNSYYILYPRIWLDLEGYNIRNYSRDMPSQVHGSVQSLYYTLKNDRVQLEGTATREDFENKLSLFSTQAESLECLQSFIIAAFETVQKRGLSDKSNFFDNSLLAQTYQLKGAYMKTARALSTLPAETVPMQWKLTLLANSLNDLAAMKRCDKCHDAIGDALLECGHYICRPCFMEHVQIVMNQKGLVVEPTGEATEGLVCPLLDCRWTEKLNIRTLQLILGTELEAYQLQAEAFRHQKKCNRCAKVYEDRLFFLTNYCQCKLCVLCLIDLMKNNFGMCYCGNYIPPNVVQIVQTMSETCVGCHRVMNLLNSFTPIRCSGHILCIKCLEKALKDTEIRCPIDYRPFAPYEIEEAKNCFKRQCYLFCEKFFDSSGALDLPCGCHYCMECAKLIVVEKRLPIQNCFVCRNPFPRELTDYWSARLREVDFRRHVTLTIQNATHNPYRAAKCSICLSRIPKVQTYTLKCGHVFDRACVADYAANFINAVVMKEITCPENACGMVIDSSDLQRTMNPKDFEKYSIKLYEAKNKIIQCPKCHTGHSAEGMNEAVNAHVACQSCLFNFCLLCSQEWQDNHDINRCKHDDLQRQIKMLEAALGPKNIIMQCPTCKVPYLKDDACEHIICYNHCPDWCFQCSCLRQPTLSHHAMWHRPSCKFYVPVPDNEPMKQNCPECIKLGIRCDPPKDLKVKGRFDIDEA